MNNIIEFQNVSFRYDSDTETPLPRVICLLYTSTRLILHLSEIPKPDDTADALAMAICHAHASGSLMGKLREKGLKVR